MLWLNLIWFSYLIIYVEGNGGSKPNILFIVIDDLKQSALGCYGDFLVHTPNINKLASKSFLFTNAFAQQALCAPSRNSFLTSRRPDSLHLYDFYSYWRHTVGNFTTLPQHLKENGYYTHSIGKIFHPGISSNFSDDNPYSWSGKPFHPVTEKYMNSKVCVDSVGNLKTNLICPVDVLTQPGGTLPDIESANAAVSFLENRDKTTKLPYFLAVGFHKPHIPFRFPVEYLDYHPLENITLPKNRWKPSLLPNVAWNPWNDVRRRDDIKKLNVSFPFGPMSDEVTRKIIQSYSSAVTYIDDLIGKLLKEIGNDTIVVLTSDHGWSYGEHGEFGKYSNFHTSTKVPLIIHVPSMSDKQIIMNELVELVDLFPTLVELTELSKPLEKCLSSGKNSVLCTEGRSLVPLMINKLNKKTVHKEKSAIFTQYPRPNIFPSKNPNSDEPKLKDIKIMGYSMTTDRYRYSVWIKFENKNFTVDWNTVYGKELYDHLIDPDEDMNIVDRPELSQVSEKLREKLLLGWRYA